MRTRLVERILLVVLAVAALGLAWTASTQRRRLDDLAARVADTEMRLRMVGEAAKLRAAHVPAPDLFQPNAKAQAPRPGAAEGGSKRPGPGAAARGRTPPVPGANVLDHLYEAADELAVSEQWDDATYDGVAQVFDDTTSTMLDLWKDVQGGRVSIAQARKQAMEVRESAQVRLQAVLGEEGFDRLRSRIKEDFAELMPPR